MGDQQPSLPGIEGFQDVRLLLLKVGLIALLYLTICSAKIRAKNKTGLKDFLKVGISLA